jgi:ligand-binding sensor domain-containing protein
MFSKTILHLLIGVLMMPLALRGQATLPGIAIGSWRTHTSYESASSVADAGDKIYCASEKSFFYVDESGSLMTLSKIDGFSDFNISKIKYSPELNLLLIGYDNGNIDIIKDNKIININDISRKTITSDKSFNHIHFYKKYAYLSFNFGLIILDCEKFEIKETYNSILPGNELVKIKGSLVVNDSLFVLTEKGVLVAPMNANLNLMDSKSWYRYTMKENLPVENLISLVDLNNRVYTCSDAGRVYYLKDKKWEVLNISPGNIRFMTNSAGRIILGRSNHLTYLFPDFSFSEMNNYMGGPNDACIDKTGKLWVADEFKGLLTDKYSSTPQLAQYIPNGPYTPLVLKVNYSDGKIFGFPGGYKISGDVPHIPGGYYIFEDNTWRNYLIGYRLPLPAEDFIDSYYNPLNKYLYIASMRQGLIVVKPDSSFDQYNETNSPLTNAHKNATPVSDIEADKNGNLWILNPPYTENKPTLHELKKDGQWGKSIAFPEGALLLIQLVIDDNDYKWMRTLPSSSQGIIVYDSNKDKIRNLTANAGSGNLSSGNINCMTKDLKGQMWIGTTKGVSIFTDPSKIFNSSNFDAVSPIVAGFPLLFDQNITCIKVDGGNRKWIGTQKGLWLFNDDGTESILYFTTENSPLPSDYILDVTIQEKTGEVFIATDQGLISYRGTATESNEKFGTVSVFPNPVKPGFRGTVGITGLATDVSVKITDIFGNLIYETKSEGGMATWNLKNYNGSWARSGLYLIFCADENGEETLVSKMAIVE